MKGNFRQATQLVILTLCSAAVFAGASDVALAKGQIWTIDTRAAKLMQEINEGQKSGELTLKEAKKLRGDLADIAHRKSLLKGANDGKVSDADKNKIEGDLNKVSAKIHKLELAKRVQAK